MALNSAARHSEIDIRYAWHARQMRERKAPLTMTTMRTAELERVYRSRFGRHFPQSSEGIDALTIMAGHHIQRNSLEVVIGWIEVRAPWTGNGYSTAIAEKAANQQRRWKAAELGWRIKLTTEERRRHRIR